MSEIIDDDIFNQNEDPIPNVENYNDDSIVHLEDMEHIRRRPGMYIGKLGDGASQDDGIYVLIKEVIDNSIDEFTSGFGKKIEVTVNKAEKKVSIRDYGRGIPLGKLKEAVSQLNTGAKYDSKVFQKSVGLNGVGTKAVNALSSYFKVQSIREGKTRIVEFAQGKLVNDSGIIEVGPSTGSGTDMGTLTEFIPDSALFGNYHYVDEYIEKRVWNYAYLNRGLSLIYNDKRYYSKNGLLDLLQNNMEGEGLYPIIHIKDGDFEAAFTRATTSIPSSMDSTPPKAVRTSPLSAKATPVWCASSTRRNTTPPTSVKAWFAPCAFAYKNLCLRHRPRPNSAPPTWPPTTLTAPTTAPS